MATSASSMEAKEALERAEQEGRERKRANRPKGYNWIKEEVIGGLNRLRARLKELSSK